MLVQELKKEIYIEIRKNEMLLKLTTHPEKKYRIKKKLEKLYRELEQILWNENENKEKKGIELPKKVLEEDEKTKK